MTLVVRGVRFVDDLEGAMVDFDIIDIIVIVINE